MVVRDLSAGYGQYPVTFDVSLELRRGRIRALLGPNGAGKSTTLLAISGLVQRFSGDIEVDGQNLNRVASYRRTRAGLVQVPEDHSLFFGLTVDENLRLAAGRRGIKHAYRLFPELDNLRGRKAGLLSGGEQQMLAIGRAFEVEPKYLMIDEMSLGLAPLVAQRVAERLKAAVAETNVGVLLVEQNFDMAIHFADDVTFMSAGRVRFDGDKADALENWDALRAAFFE